MNDRWRDEQARREYEARLRREAGEERNRGYGQGYGQDTQRPDQGEYRGQGQGYGSGDYDRNPGYARSQSYQQPNQGENGDRRFGQGYDPRGSGPGAPFQASSYQGSSQGYGGQGRGNSYSTGGREPERMGPRSDYARYSEPGRGYDQELSRGDRWNTQPNRSGDQGYYGAGGYEPDRREQRDRYDTRGGQGGYRGEDRSWFDRARDEVGAWFGDDEAERRRQMDAARHPHRDHDHDTGWNDPVRGDNHRRQDRDRW